MNKLLNKHWYINKGITWLLEGIWPDKSHVINIIIDIQGQIIIKKIKYIT